MAKSPGPIIGPSAVKVIEKAVELTFERAKARLLGPQAVSKRIAIGFLREMSLPGLFESAAREEGYKPDVATLTQLLKIASGYIDATKEQTKARVVKEVTAFLQDAHSQGVKTNLETVLGGKLTEVFADAAVSMRRIIDTEANNVKNVGILDGIVRINAASGVEDPVVYFVSVNDKSRCGECTRLHTLEGTTPRLWYLSELGNGYHTKGDANPKVGGLHPNCRCTMATLMKGYGFIGGRIAYIARDHDEMAKQRGPSVG